jgi:hypothetical protein
MTFSKDALFSENYLGISSRWFMSWCLLEMAEKPNWKLASIERTIKGTVA